MSFESVDPFDLPDWLGTGEVWWTPSCGIGRGHQIPGALMQGEQSIACDLLAIDQAYPAPVADDALRTRAHQAWQHGQLELASYDGRLTLLVPGNGFRADDVLEAVTRLAKAVGAAPESYAVHLRLGSQRG